MCSNIRRCWIMSCFSPCADTVTQCLSRTLASPGWRLFLDSWARDLYYPLANPPLSITLLLIKLTCWTWGGVGKPSAKSWHVGRGLSTWSKSVSSDNHQLGCSQLFCHLVSCPDDKRVYYSRQLGWMFPISFSSLVLQIWWWNPEELFNGIFFASAEAEGQ